MRTLLVVWWSSTGGTRQLVEALCEGAARAEGERVRVRCLRADQAGVDDLLEASGYLFAAPENLGTVAGVMKDFFDRTYYGALERLNGRPYAVVVCAGTDGAGALRQIERIATGWRLRSAAPGLVVRTGAQTPEAILAPKRIKAEDLDRAAELGGAMAAGIALGVL